MKFSGSEFDRVINQDCAIMDTKALLAIYEAGCEQFPMTLRMLRLYNNPSNDPVKGSGLMTLTRALCMLYNRVSLSNPHVETAEDLLLDLVKTGQDITIAPGMSVADAFLKGYGNVMLKDLNIRELSCYLCGMTSVATSLILCQKALLFSKVEANKDLYKSRIRRLNSFF